MSLGVLNNLSAVYAENNLNNTTNSLNTVLQQLSSGSKINSGADDAAGLSLVNGLQANQMALNQSQTNATEGVGLLQVADGALSQVTSLLNRAVTLATEASNGTLNGSQDTAANQEYQSILSEINNIGTTTSFNQEQVFGSNTNIYTGDSSASGASINDLNIRTLSSSNVGDTAGTMAYSSGATQGNVFVDLSNDGTLAQATDSLGASTSTTVVNVSHLTTGADGAVSATTSAITVGYGTQYANTAQGLMSAINGSGLGLTATFGTAAQAGSSAAADANAAQYGGSAGADTGIIISGSGVGSGTNAAGELGTLSLANSADTLSGTLNLTDSSGKSHSITLGGADSTDTLANLAATINSAGYGVTAAVATNATSNVSTLTFTSASSAASVTGSSITDSPNGNTTVTQTTTTAANADAGSAEASGTTIETLAVGNPSDTLGGTLVLKGVDGSELGGASGIALGTAGSTDTIANLAATINNFAVTDSNFALSATVSADGKTLTIATTANAALHVAGVGAFSGNLQGTITSATSTQTAVGVTLANQPTSGAPSSASIGTLGLSGTSAAVTDVLSGSLTIGSNAAITLGGTGTTDTLQDLAKTINSGNYGVTAAYNQTAKDIVFTSSNSSIVIAGTSIADHTAASTNTTNSNFNDNAVAAYTAQSPSSVSSSYYSTGISVGAGAVYSSGSKVVDTGAAIAIVDQNTVVGTGSNNATLTYGGTTNTGIVSDASGAGGIATISYTDASGQSLATTDLSNQTSAQAALTNLNAAISDVSAQDGYIGAQINQLNAASSVLSTQSENVQSAQNAVQATDYASATSNMSKYEILSQTGISALAQANSMQQEVTKLLQ